jgi:hypothetical protein
MADLYTHAFSDNIRLAKSKRLIAPADATYNIIRIPQFAFVKQVWLWISTAYAGGAPVVTIGFMGNGEVADVDGFMTNIECDPSITGVKTSLGGTAVWADGKYFDSAGGAITYTTTLGTTAGTVTVFADYTVVH